MRIVACMAAAIPRPLHDMKQSKTHSDKTGDRSNTAQIHRRRRLLLSLATVLCLATTALFLSLLRVQADSPAVPPRDAAGGDLAGSPAPAAPAQVPNTTIPPLPPGVTELKFNEFFVKPVGARGLELSVKLRGLEGGRVRILGYMAQRREQPPGSFVLTPYSLQAYEDFPAGAVQVSVPTLRGQTVPYVPGLMLLTGTLTTGNRVEPDGRVSLVRLALDPPDVAMKQSRQAVGIAGKPVAAPGEQARQGQRLNLISFGINK